MESKHLIYLVTEYAEQGEMLGKTAVREASLRRSFSSLDV